MSDSTNISTEQLQIGYNKQMNSVIIPDLKLYSGKLYALVGNNGEGKSTFLKTVAGLIPNLSGGIKINNQNLKNISLQDLSQQISIVLNESLEDVGMKVFDFVALGRIPYINITSKLNDEDLEIINESISLLGIAHLKDKNLNHLSDGERQKCNIARAVCQNTPIILLDEPSAFLDYNTKRELFNCLKKLAVSKQKLIIVSSHDLDLMLPYADECIFIKNKTASIHAAPFTTEQFL